MKKMFLFLTLCLAILFLNSPVFAGDSNETVSTVKSSTFTTRLQIYYRNVVTGDQENIWINRNTDPMEDDFTVPSMELLPGRYSISAYGYNSEGQMTVHLKKYERIFDIYSGQFTDLEYLDLVLIESMHYEFQIANGSIDDCFSVQILNEENNIIGRSNWCPHNGNDSIDKFEVYLPTNVEGQFRIRFNFIDENGEIKGVVISKSYNFEDLKDGGLLLYEDDFEMDDIPEVPENLIGSVGFSKGVRIVGEDENSLWDGINDKVVEPYGWTTYKITLKAGNYYTLYVVPPQEGIEGFTEEIGDPRVAVWEKGSEEGLNPEKATVYRDDDNYFVGEQRTTYEVVHFQVPQTGDYVIGITGAGDQTGGYFIQMNEEIHEEPISGKG